MEATRCCKQVAEGPGEPTLNHTSESAAFHHWLIFLNCYKATRKRPTVKATQTLDTHAPAYTRPNLHTNITFGFMARLQWNIDTWWCGSTQSAQNNHNIRLYWFCSPTKNTKTSICSFKYPSLLSLSVDLAAKYPAMTQERRDRAPSSSHFLQQHSFCLRKHLTWIQPINYSNSRKACRRFSNEPKLNKSWPKKKKKQRTDRAHRCSGGGVFKGFVGAVNHYSQHHGSSKAPLLFLSPY